MIRNLYKFSEEFGALLNTHVKERVSDLARFRTKFSFSRNDFDLVLKGYSLPYWSTVSGMIKYMKLPKDKKEQLFLVYMRTRPNFDCSLEGWTDEERLALLRRVEDVNREVRKRNKKRE